jgi:hypothetical protein
MVAVKNNLAPLGNGLAYRIEASGEVARIAWKLGIVTLDANSELSVDRQEQSDRGARKPEAETRLLRLLASGEEMPVSKIIKLAEGAPFSWRTVEQAKKENGVRAVKRGRVWAWVRA